MTDQACACRLVFWRQTPWPARPEAPAGQGGAEAPPAAEQAQRPQQHAEQAQRAQQHALELGAPPEVGHGACTFPA